MLCDVILPFLFLYVCQTDETLAGYAERHVAYHLVEQAGQDNVPSTIFRITGRKQFSVTTPCGSFAGRFTAPLPWIEIPEPNHTPAPCEETAAVALVIGDLTKATLAEIAGDVIMLSDDAGPILTFRRMN